MNRTGTIGHRASAPTVTVGTAVPRSLWRELHASDPDAVPTQAPEWLDCLTAMGGYQDATRLYEMPDGRRALLAGGRARLELQLFDLHWLGEGSRAMIGAQYQYDDVRGDLSGALLSVQIPLGGSGRRPNRLQRRMLDPVVRDVNIVRGPYTALLGPGLAFLDITTVDTAVRWSGSVAWRAMLTMVSASPRITLARSTTCSPASVRRIWRGLRSMSGTPSSFSNLMIWVDSVG